MRTRKADVSQSTFVSTWSKCLVTSLMWRPAKGDMTLADTAVKKPLTDVAINALRSQISSGLRVLPSKKSLPTSSMLRDR